MISVLMSTYRENPSEASLAIDSILNQTYKGDLELIIVFDDPNNHEFKSWAKEEYGHDPRVVLVENEKNLGLANSLNKAFRVSKGDYIARMDADDVSYPDRIELQLDYLVNNDLDLIGGKLITIDESGNELYGIPAPPHSSKMVRTASRWNNCLPHPTWFGKRAVFEQEYRNIPLCGKPVCEDYDFQIRALLKGYKLGNINKTVLKYRIKADSLSKSDIYVQFLFQKYLTKEYLAGRVVDIEESISMLAPMKDSKAAKKYALSQDKFNEGMARLSSGKPLNGIRDILSAVLSSPSFLDKTRRLALASLAGKFDAKE